MASIREREGKVKSYQVRYYINGKLRSKMFRATDNSKQAEKAAEKAAKAFKKQIEAELNLDIAKDESRLTFAEYAETVFKIRDKNASYQTLQTRKTYLSKVNDLIGNIRLKEFSPLKLKTLLMELSEHNSDQVLQKYKQIINIVLDSAAEDELIEYNPMQKVKFKISQKNLHEVKPADMDAFRNYITFAEEQKKYAFGLWLMLYTGMRVGEVLALRLDDFDFTSNVININKNRMRNSELGPVKKGRNRKFPIHEKIAELYYEAKEWQVQNKALFADSYQDNNLFLCHEDGRPVTYSAFKTYLRKLDVKTGIKLRPHQLRHTFATFVRGMELKDIQQMGGWKDADTLINTYQDHDGFKDETVQTLDKIFKKI